MLAFLEIKEGKQCGNKFLIGGVVNMLLVTSLRLNEFFFVSLQDPGLLLAGSRVFISSKPIIYDLI